MRKSSATQYYNTMQAPMWDMMFRIIVLGDSDVGKSSFVRSFVEGSYKSNLDSTVGADFFFKILQLPDCTVKLQIWDTAGGERFRAITHSYYRNSAGVLLTFDVCSKQSFSNISTWIEQVRVYTGNPNVTILLVGNKIDLPNKRQVTMDEALSFAEKLRVQYVEVSAKEMINVGRAFNLLTSAIHQKFQKGLFSSNMEGSGVCLNTYLLNNGLERNDRNFNRNSVVLQDCEYPYSASSDASCCGGGSQKSSSSSTSSSSRAKPI